MLDSEESRIGRAWAFLLRSSGMRFDSDALHPSSPLRGTSRSLLSKTATSLRRFSAVARYLSQAGADAIGSLETELIEISNLTKMSKLTILRA
jgi:hypothetical protein